ncbi:HAD-IA family hydrolase [Desulfovibrio sp. OttesenSCG-928-C14]|nr:HAD-IA family hydrolase [Desulfovibrio sp. OttesenSCG-928-C14]
MRTSELARLGQILTNPDLGVKLIHLKGLIFDCDGVLLDSRNANISYYNFMRESLSLPKLTPEEEEYVHMATYEQAMNFIVPEERREEIPALINLAERELDYFSLLSREKGLLDLLKLLKKNNIQLALCTNRFEPMDNLLTSFSLDGFFSPRQTASNSRPKPDPDGLNQVLRKWVVAPHEVAFLGDSRADAQAAKSAGIPFWSFKNPDLEADLYIPGFTALRQWMEPYLDFKKISQYG